MKFSFRHSLANYMSGWPALKNSEPTWKHDDPIVWTPELVKHLQGSDYKVAQVVDYWIDSILGSFIVEFAIDTSVSYSEAE